MGNFVGIEFCQRHSKFQKNVWKQSSETVLAKFNKRTSWTKKYVHLPRVLIYLRKKFQQNTLEDDWENNLAVKQKKNNLKSHSPAGVKSPIYNLIKRIHYDLTNKKRNFYQLLLSCVSTLRSEYKDGCKKSWFCLARNFCRE